MSAPDYYTVLGVERTATADAIRRAFHEVARRHHPDRWAQEPEAARQAAEAHYRRAAEAYRVLMEPRDRARYDALLAQGETRLGAAPSEVPGARPPPAGAMVVKTPKARPFWQKAQEAIKAGDLKSAKLNLKLAANAEPGNPAIEALLRDIESKR